MNDLSSVFFSSSTFYAGWGTFATGAAFLG